MSCALPPERRSPDSLVARYTLALTARNEAEAAALARPSDTEAQLAYQQARATYMQAWQDLTAQGLQLVAS